MVAKNELKEIMDELPKIPIETKEIDLLDGPAKCSGSSGVSREHYYNSDCSLGLSNEVRAISINAPNIKELKEMYELFKNEGLIEFVKTNVEV